MVERAKLVYLAGPVRSLGRSAATDIRKPLEIYFLRRGMVTFNPPGAWCCDMSDPCEDTIKLGNDAVLMTSSMMAAIFIPEVESKGTDSEMVLAASIRIPIIVVCMNRDDVSDAIAWVNPLMALSKRSGSVSVEYTVLRGSKLDSITTIIYEPVVEGVAG